MTADTVFDVAILGGRAIDPETGLDAVRNIGVRDGMIAIITPDPIQGRETVQADGLVVAPGFIDMHHHNAGVPFGEKLALRDGVTTPLELEAGVSPVGDWYASLEGRCRTNYGATVGTIAARERTFNPSYRTKYAGDVLYDLVGSPQDTGASMKWSTEVPTDDELQQIAGILEEGLREGAIGIGHCPGYMVAGCTTAESVKAQELAGKYGRATYVHARFSSQMPPTSGLLGFLEQMAAQEIYGGGLLLMHMTAQALGDTARALELIDAARKAGISVLPEVYPYDYGGTIVGADYLHPDNYGPNMGRDYSDITETATVTPLTKERYDELVRKAPTTSVMFKNATEQTVYMALAHETSVLGSDAFPYSMKSDGSVVLDWETPFDAVNGHPRGAGSHAKLLRLVREGTVDIPLPLAIAKMSTMIAQFLEQNGVAQMARKGRLQESMDADITLFDPETVTDNATMRDGGLPSTGIPHVLVNGVTVVRGGETVDDVFPGRPIRCARGAA
ncbi:MAG: amidohydrolase family protein [Pseudomonadota bacterium]